MLEEILRTIIAEKRLQGMNNNLIKNFLKEYIQYLVLSLIYNQKKFKKMVFKGGSCLRICFDLPRLSEDLDFDYEKDEVEKKVLDGLERYLKTEIKTKFFNALETKIQSSIRLYLKFSILKQLKLASGSESDMLYVKIETSEGLSPYATFSLTPISKFGYNFIVYHYDLPSLMSGKINALLYRVWFKGEKNQIDIKGRDFYDLFWFLQKQVEPNWPMLKKMTGIKNKAELKKVLKDRIKKSVTPQKLAYDLKNFISDQVFIDEFSKNYLAIIDRYLF